MFFSSETFYAAYTYDDVYDVLIFDALYAEASHARDAVGHKGLVVRLVLDAPGVRETVSSE